MGKNANGEGSIYKRTRDGRVTGYAAALTYVDADGRTKRIRVYGPTRADAREKLNKAPQAHRKRRRGARRNNAGWRVAGALAGNDARGERP